MFLPTQTLGILIAGVIIWTLLSVFIGYMLGRNSAQMPVKAPWRPEFNPTVPKTKPTPYNDLEPDIFTQAAMGDAVTKARISTIEEKE